MEKNKKERKGSFSQERGREERSKGFYLYYTTDYTTLGSFLHSGQETRVPVEAVLHG